MIEIKNIKNLSFIFDSDKDCLGLSFSEYARFISKAETTIRRKAKKEKYGGQIYSVTLAGQNYKLVPVDICLQWLVTDKPEKITIFTNAVKTLTGKDLKFPDFSITNIKSVKNKSYNPRGLLYLFESKLGILKLGFTKNIRQRVSQLQRWENELTIVNVVEGSIYKEKELHKILHATGEFFGDEWYPITRKEEIINMLQNIYSRG
ncbi:hypothetical protein [Pseudanabaena phage PA-SR01]|nr:hypothetical protein [Pseudanabaena phage PA-SR01]